MKHIILFFAALFFLVACSTPSTPPIATFVPQTLTFTPTQIQATETLVPTDTVTPVSTLDPEAWNEAGNVVWQNKNLAPHGKQIVVNPELSGQFGTDVMDLCNKITYLGALANEFNKLGMDAPPAPTGDLKDFDTYMANVIKPAIDKGEMIQGWHLVGHTDSSKRPYLGMVESLPDFDPSVCSIRIGGRTETHSNNIVIGDYLQIGMDIIEKDGKQIRELHLNIAKETKNNAGIPYANPEMPDTELALSFSQILNIKHQQIDRAVINIPTNPTTRNDFVSISSKKDRIGFMYELPGINTYEIFIKDKDNSPAFFVAPHTP